MEGVTDRVSPPLTQLPAIVRRGAAGLELRGKINQSFNQYLGSGPSIDTSINIDIRIMTFIWTTGYVPYLHFMPVIYVVMEDF